MDEKNPKTTPNVGHVSVAQNFINFKRNLVNYEIFIN